MCDNHEKEKSRAWRWYWLHYVAIRSAEAKRAAGTIFAKIYREDAAYYLRQYRQFRNLDRRLNLL